MSVVGRHIDNIGVKLLAEGIKSNSKLKGIWIGGDDINDKGLAHLMASINPNIVSIFICSSCVKLHRWRNDRRS